MPSMHQHYPEKITTFEKIAPQRVYIGVGILWLLGLIFVIAAIIIPVDRIQSINQIYDFKSAEIRQIMIRKALPMAILTGVLSGGMGLWLIGIGVMTLRYSRKDRDLRIQTTPDGLIQTKGHTPTRIRWDDIETVHYAVILVKVSGLRMPPSHIYTLTCKDGQQYQFDNTIKHVYELGESIQAQVAQRKLPGAIAALKRGETLAFGPFSITEEGITTTARGSVAWNEIVEVEVFRGWVTVRRKTSRGTRNFASIKLQKIPNLGLFLALARYYKEMHRCKTNIPYFKEVPMNNQVSNSPQVSWTWADMFLTYRFWGLVLFYMFSQASSRLVSTWLPVHLHRNTAANATMSAAMLNYAIGISALLGFYPAWAATRRKPKAMLLIAGTLQLVGGLLLTSGPSTAMPLRFVGAALCGIGSGAITMGIPAILAGGTKRAQAFVITFGLLFAVTYVSNSLLNMLVGVVWEHIGPNTLPISETILVFLGLLTLLPVNSELFTEPPKARTCDWSVQPRNPVLVAVGSLITPVFYYFLYKFHGEVASLRPSSKTLSPHGALFTIFLLPFTFSAITGLLLTTTAEGTVAYIWLAVISIALTSLILLSVMMTSLVEALNEHAEEHDEPPLLAPWVVLISTVLLFPVAMGLLQQALNRSLALEQETA